MRLVFTALNRQCTIARRRLRYVQKESDVTREWSHDTWDITRTYFVLFVQIYQVPIYFPPADIITKWLKQGTRRLSRTCRPMFFLVYKVLLYNLVQRIYLVYYKKNIYIWHNPQYARSEYHTQLAHRWVSTKYEYIRSHSWSVFYFHNIYGVPGGAINSKPRNYWGQRRRFESHSSGLFLIWYKSTGRKRESVRWPKTVQIDEQKKLKKGNAEL